MARSLNICLLCLLHPLCLPTDQPDVADRSAQVMAVAGEDVILPCSLNPPVDAEAQTVEWTRQDLNTTYVHVHQHGRDEYTTKDENKQDRTTLFLNQLRTGNLSLKIFNVRLSDQGLYRCFIPDKHESFVNLVVVAVSELNLSIVKSSDSGLVLQCDSKGWYPKPELSWLDGEGNLLPAGSTDPVQGPDDDLYTVSSNITVEKASRFTCRVQLPKTNHSREKDIPVPALQRTDVGCIISIASNVILLVVIAILGLITGQPVEKLKAVCRSICPGISSQPDDHSTPGSAVKRRTKQGDGDSADNQPLRQTV